MVLHTTGQIHKTPMGGGAGLTVGSKTRGSLVWHRHTRKVQSVFNLRYRNYLGKVRKKFWKYSAAWHKKKCALDLINILISSFQCLHHCHWGQKWWLWAQGEPWSFDNSSWTERHCLGVEQHQLSILYPVYQCKAVTKCDLLNTSV